MKNNASKFFKQCQALKTHFKVLLSGTPLQNNFDELFNLMEFIDPVKFDSSFRDNLNQIRSDILQNQSTKTLRQEERSPKPEPDGEPKLEGE